MLIYPAIDLFEGKAVRLFKGDYAQMTVYSEHPEEIALDFKAQGASCIHLVDLEGARSGETPNFETVRRIREACGLFCEVGGGVRSMEVIEKYLDSGVNRIILGTAAVTEPGFLEKAAGKYGEKIAVGVDIKDGFVAVKGWTEKSTEEAFDFCRRMNDLGVKTLICTDISRDGAMQGTNLSLYQDLSNALGMQIIASGGVSSMEDVRDGRVVKGVNFQKLSDVSSPVELAKFYSENGADELVFYDITASAEGRRLFTDILCETAKSVFIPLTVGGGINTLDDFDRVLKCGADKVSVNSGAIRNPALVGEAAKAEDRSETIYEIADLAYHVMVLMVQAGISLEDIHKELASRHVIDHKVKQEKMT